ncbi:23S ribosomal RNA methyltransferase Erm [Streptomyces sp. NBC_01255]|uniref:23S ribosomal RNA methyltransferase Erm n=1 Tax=Streptomyces sp. NBC_01255 TaxID=2903798 RepID=UPI002E34A926|nr:23S ribosomal RNA methyltransferase Erm [Streptomyces sp. NBC_01255]
MAVRDSIPRRADRDVLRRELGQNFLQDDRAVRNLVRQVEGDGRHVLEIGPGKGAITEELLHSFDTVTAVEMDPHWAAHIRRKFDREKVTVFQGDFLDFRFPREIDTVVGNVPFGITTQILRRLLESTNWQSAALIVQWEVARKRAGRSGGSLLTTSWAPWYEFTLHDRVRATSFRPMPSVDGGILTIRRRPRPLLPESASRAFQQFAEAVFTGPGRGLAEILRRHIPKRTYRSLADRHGIPDGGLPKDLTLTQWIALFQASQPGYAPGATGARMPAQGGGGREYEPEANRTRSTSARPDRTPPATPEGRRFGPTRGGDPCAPRAQVRQTKGRQGARGSSYGRRTGR